MLTGYVGFVFVDFEGFPASTLVLDEPELLLQFGPAAFAQVYGEACGILSAGYSRDNVNFRSLFLPTTVTRQRQMSSHLIPLSAGLEPPYRSQVTGTWVCHLFSYFSCHGQVAFVGSVL